jgi:hypothetical protein
VSTFLSNAQSDAVVLAMQPTTAEVVRVPAIGLASAASPR